MGNLMYTVVGAKLNYLRRLWCFSAVDVLLVVHVVGQLKFLLPLVT